MSAYRSSPIKRPRRTKADIVRLRDTIASVVDEVKPATVRQVFYQLVSRGVIAKSEAEYKNTVCRLLAEMRRDGQISYYDIADNTRWMRKPDTYTSLPSMLHHAQYAYRRALWDDQDAYVEIWLEKEALAGVLVDVTAEWDVPLMVTRGYPSLSFLHSAAEQIRATEKPTFLYYFGDRDPSGVDIPRNVLMTILELLVPEVVESFSGDKKAEAGLRLAKLYERETPLHFEVVAVTSEQIEQLNLPTRPTKKSDSRAKSFEGESVEVDAIPPATLRQLARDCIEQHIDQERLARTLHVEDLERETLAKIAGGLGGAA